MLKNGTSVHSTVELAENTMVLTTNSSTCAERGQALVASAFGSLTRTPLTKIETVEQLRASRQPHAADLSNEIPPDMRTEVVRVTLDKRHRQILDKPVGMLDDITQRTAAKTKKDREKLIIWLKFLEN